MTSGLSFRKLPCDNTPNAHNVVRGLVGDVRAVEVYLTPLAFEIPFEIAPVPRPSPCSNPSGPTLPHAAARVQTARRRAGRAGRAVGAAWPPAGGAGGHAPELSAQKCL